MKIEMKKLVLQSIIFFVILLSIKLNAQDAVIGIDPVTQTVESSQVVTVTVAIENVQNLGAFEFDMIFDSNILNVQSATPGEFPGSSGRTVIPVGPDLDNSTNPGKITFGVATLGTANGPNGNGILAVIEFLAQANGNSPIEFQSIQISDINGQLLSFDNVVHGSVTVGSQPPPGTVVTNTNDSGTGSLRWAIEQANLTPESNEITFAIPLDDPGYESENGIWRIKPASELPALQDAGMNLDGWSQGEVAGDINPDGPEIVLDGSAISGTASGLLVGANDVAIYGLNIQNFSNAGILVSGAQGTFITECLIGTDHLGQNAAANYDGILLINDAQETLIGAEGDSMGNVISGNTRFGIFISGASNNQISNNLIGINQAESDTLGNHGHGISIQYGSTSNHILSNFIGGNGDGVAIINSDSTEIRGNLIGTDSTFSLQFGQQTDGIYLWGNSRYTEIVENVIGYNFGYGISVGSSEALYNHISENAISRNSYEGIMNWSGGNSELPPPTISSITDLLIQGKAQPEQIIEIFADEANQGRAYLGSTESAAAGDFSFELNTPPPYENITATATDENGNTSGFSAPVHYIATSVDLDTKIPTQFSLSQNFPNPFNPTTTIYYEIPQAGHVSVKIFNTTGQLVDTLVDEFAKAGIYQKSWRAEDMPSGVYYYSIAWNYEILTSKMLLLK